MIFKCFSESIELMDSLDWKVNNYITKKEEDGYIFKSKTVHVERAGDNSLIKPYIVITVWMEDIWKSL